MTAAETPATAHEGRDAASRVPARLRSAAIVVGIAVAGWVLLRPTPIPDSWWALIWGREVLDGGLPQVDVPGAPSVHPLGVAVGALVGLFGRAAAVDLFNALVLLSLGAILLGIFRLGQVLFGTAVAWVALAATLCNFTLASVVMFSSLDVTAYALTVWAAVLVAARPTRGVAPLVLVGIAGLQRPEVWILSAAYWLYLAVSLRDLRRAAALAVLAAAPVASWIVFDLVVTGRFLGSLHTIQSVAAGIDNGHEAPLLEQMRGAVPPAFRVPLIPVALLGIGLAAYLRVRPAILPAVVGFLGLVAAVVYYLADIIIVSRFLVITALMCSLFVGYAVIGGRGTPGLVGRAWRIAGVLAGLVVLAVGARQVQGVHDLRTGLRHDTRAAAQEFARLAEQPRVARVLDRCTSFWEQSQDPAVMYFGGVVPKHERLALSVPTPGGPDGRVPDRGALLRGLSPLGLPPQPASSFRLVLPAGFSRVGSSGRWTLYERGC